MLEYRKGFLGLSSLLYIEGSALPRALLPACLMTGLAAVAGSCWKDDLRRRSSDPLNEGIFIHPYPYQIYIFLLGFLLVFRTSFSYHRYTNARTHVATMSSKWADAVTFVAAFGLAPFISGNGGQMHHAFMLRLIHRCSCMHALALQALREDYNLDNLESCSEDAAAGTAAASARRKRSRCAGGNDSDPGPSLNYRVEHVYTDIMTLMGITYYDEKRHQRAVGHARLPVIGLQRGMELLDGAALSATRSERVVVLMSAVQIMLEGARMGGKEHQPFLSGSGPIDTRLYHVLSDGFAGFSQAQKIVLTPFPFPYSQLTVALLVAFSVFTPLVMASFIISLPMLCVMCFTIGLMYWSLHEVAREIEDPFRYKPNDLPLEDIQRQFNERISMAYLVFASESVRLSLAGTQNSVESTDLPAFEASIRDDIVHAATDPSKYAKIIHADVSSVHDDDGIRLNDMNGDV